MKKTDSAKDRLWEQIKPEIKTDGLYYEYNRESLARAISDLPDSDPQQDLWAVIHENIREYEIRINSRKLYIYLSGVAAVIIMFIATIILYQSISLKQIKKISEQNIEESVESFLAQVCSVNPAKCTEAGFIELKSAILNLYNAKMEVSNSMFANPEDVDIIQVTERINSQINSLKSQIIKYVE